MTSIQSRHNALHRSKPEWRLAKRAKSSLDGAKLSKCPVVRSFSLGSAALAGQSLERPHILHSLLRLRPKSIIGIDVDRADHTFGVDDEPAGHRQGPAVLAVANGEIITEAQVNLLQFVRELEPNPELFRILVATVGKQIEPDFMLVDQLPGWPPAAAV